MKGEREGRSGGVRSREREGRERANQNNATFISPLLFFARCCEAAVTECDVVATDFLAICQDYMCAGACEDEAGERWGGASKAQCFTNKETKQTASSCAACSSMSVFPFLEGCPLPALRH